MPIEPDLIRMYEKRRRENILSGLTRDTRLSRIFRWNRLQEILRSQQLCLSRFSTWEDPFEAFIFKGRGKAPTGETVSFAQLAHYAYGQCWTLEGESDALWRIYSHIEPSRVSNDLGVRVSTTVGKLFDAVYGDGSQTCIKLYIGKVEYYDASDVSDSIAAAKSILSNVLMDTSGKTQVLPLLIKRREFEHEREVRLVYAATSDDPRIDENHILFPIDTKSVFDSAQLDPRLPVAQVEEVGAALSRLGFDGPVSKSRLYEPPDFEFPFDL